MKKFFAIAFVAASLVACNSGGEKKEGGDTATKAPADTAAAIIDTANKAVDAAMDTAAKKIDAAMDTAAKKIEEIKK